MTHCRPWLMAQFDIDLMRIALDPQAVACREALMGGQGVKFSVVEAGETVLIYQMGSIAEAVERLEFIREFFPRARFVFEPLTH